MKVLVCAQNPKNLQLKIRKILSKYRYFIIDRKLALHIPSALKSKVLTGSEMKLESLLLEKKSTILERWFDLILGSYPPETSRLLKREKDRFDNPVAYDFHEGIKGVYEALLHGMERDRISSVLDRIISIRAIQDLLPSEVVAFIFLLKTAMRRELQREIREKGINSPN